MVLEGFGTDSAFGFGGTVYRVTNLNTSGDGSFYAAVTAAGARIVVFEVSGTIQQDGIIDITNDDLCILGQTAPSPGIQMRGMVLAISADDVLVQHVRFRAGDKEGYDPDSRDNIKVYGENVVIDHCTLQWSCDENISFPELATTTNCTVSNCIISEPLIFGKDPIEKVIRHGLNALQDSQVTNIAWIKNIFAHGEGRNPYVKEKGATAAVVNCILYNTKYNGVFIGADGAPTSTITVEGSYNIQGLDSVNAPYILGIHVSCQEGTTYYLNDNVYDEVGDGLNDASGTAVDGESRNPWPGGGITVLATAGDVAKDHVLVYAGAWPVARDVAEQRTIDDVTNGTGHWVESQDDVGGWPAYAENSRGLGSIPATEQGQKDWAAFYSRVVEQGVANALFF